MKQRARRRLLVAAAIVWIFALKQGKVKFQPYNKQGRKKVSIIPEAPGVVS